MLRTFENIRVGLMVGIGGGAPTRKDDIRLGDIVVSSPGNGYPGVFQYDYGKAIQNREFQTTGQLDQPPTAVRTAVQALKTTHEIHGHLFNETIGNILERSRPKIRKKYSRPTAEDQLYQPGYVHRADPEAQAHCVDVCGEDPTNLVQRRERDEDDDNPAIHHGLIASANTLMKDAETRDHLSGRHRVLCFEMEAAGLMNHFPCLVIRGICDYSDTHKNKEWQGFAAMTAAAYAKDLLLKISPTNIENESRLKDLIEPLANDIRDTRREVQEVSSSLRTADAKRKFDELYTWLSPPIASENHDRAISTRQEGSGLWFIQGREFQEWKSTQKSFLWLHGIPGCGKTVLCSSAIEDVQRGESNPVSVLYFYFDFSDHRKTSPKDMIKSLMSQLYHKQECVRKPLEELWERYRLDPNTEPRQPSFEELCSTFQKMLGNIGSAYILLDALDECREVLRPNLLSWLECIRELPIHLLVTSRAEHDISSALHGSRHPGQVVDVRSTFVTEDIRAYIRWRIKPMEMKNGEDEKCTDNKRKNLSTAHGFERWRWNTPVQDEIETKLMEKANGMFRWVKCQLDTLEHCLHYPALREALKSLPRDLHDTYARILNNLDNLKKPWTIRVLQFLAYSERPLTLDEMVDVLAVDPDAEEQDLWKNRMPFPDEITGYASTLVTLVVRKTEKGTSKELQLAHFSVKEYLTSEKSYERQFSEAHAKSDMTNVCLGYLLHLSQRMALKDLRRNFPFAQFCARYWMEYAAVAETRDETAEKIRKLANKFLTSKESFFTNCYRLYNPDNPSQIEPNDDQMSPAHALYYTSLGGLLISTRTLLDGGADVNEKGGVHGNALQAASRNGHEEIVQQLLDSGADINATAGRFGNPLSVASGFGHEEVVKRLLDNGAHVNALSAEFRARTRNFFGFRNPLQMASIGGHQKIVQRLLDSGADIDAIAGGRSALYEASAYGHKEIVKLLLDRGARINARWQGSDNALCGATLIGSVEIVKLLLDRGAYVDPISSRHASALGLASTSGYKEIVRLLLDYGANVNVWKDELDGMWLGVGDDATLASPLAYASLAGHRDIVELLIANGANIYFCSRAFGNALCKASEKGHGSVVEVLPRHKHDQEKRWNSALNAALCRGHVQVVILLLRKGTKLDGKEDGEWQPIQTTITRAYAEAIHMLLENIASPDDGGPHRREDILKAISMGFQTVSNSGGWKKEDLIICQENMMDILNEKARDTLIACIDEIFDDDDFHSCSSSLDCD